MDRVIGHIDLDYFYAQVEEVENPSIKERPVVVCVFSGRTEDSGVVATANYKARSFGVGSGLPIVTAKRKLEGKDPVVIRMDRAKYEVVSERIMQVVKSNVDVLEQTGIDEAFFDITQRSGGDYSAAKEIATKIKGSIVDVEHLSCSIGLGRSKAVAKLGSDMAKPGGLKVVDPSSTETFMNEIPVAKLYGVGPKAAAALEKLNIKTLGELSGADPSKLEREFGRKLAAYFRAAASGQDDSPVTEVGSPTQLMRIVTLKQNTTDAEESLAQLGQATADIREKLKAQSLSFRTLTALAVLTDLSTKTRSKTFETPINDLDSVKDDVLELFEDLSGSVDKEFRRVGVRVSDLSSNQDQSSLSEFLQPAR